MNCAQTTSIEKEEKKPQRLKSKMFETPIFIILHFYSGYTESWKHTTAVKKKKKFFKVSELSWFEH